MRAANLISSALAAEKRLFSRNGSRPAAHLEIDQKALARSIEISEQEILDDLMYPADRRSAGL